MGIELIAILKIYILYSLNYWLVAKCELTENVLFVMDAPNMDVVARVDKPLITKYHLPLDGQKLGEDEEIGVLDELFKNYNPVYVPGGSAYNTIKLTQWMGQFPNKTITLFGCVGNDDLGTRIILNSVINGFDCYFHVVAGGSTGKCAVFVYETYRSMLAFIGNKNGFDNYIENNMGWDIIDKSKYIYVTGFEINYIPNTLVSIAKYASENNKHYLLNLSAPYVCESHFDILSTLLPYVDILFGNDKEIRSFANVSGYPSYNLEDAAKWLRALPKVNKTRERIVVVTCGPRDTVVATTEGITKYPVIHIDENEIVDTCGAGDAFVGGFLSQLIQGKPLDYCIAAGHYAASVTIRQVGCTVPDFKPEFT